VATAVGKRAVPWCPRRLTNLAIENADIILVKNDSRYVLKVIDFSQKPCFKMAQNLWGTADYKIVAIPLAAGVLYNFGILLPSAVGALIMSLGTVIVTFNS
jgi:Cu2+-exporting ATPase